jgi:hypothetical protein
MSGVRVITTDNGQGDLTILWSDYNKIVEKPQGKCRCMKCHWKQQIEPKHAKLMTPVDYDEISTHRYEKYSRVSQFGIRFVPYPALINGANRNLTWLTNLQSLYGCNRKVPRDGRWRMTTTS